MVRHKKNPIFWGLFAWGAWGCTPLTTKRERERERMARGYGLDGDWPVAAVAQGGGWHG